MIVVVDDRLPVGRDGELLFAKTLDETLWAPLLEKAYAKLHKSYAAIQKGSMMEAIADLTGYLPSVLDTRCDSAQAGIRDGSLAQKIYAHSKMGGLMGAAALSCRAIPSAAAPSSKVVPLHTGPSTGREDTEDIVRRFIAGLAPA